MTAELAAISLGSNLGDRFANVHAGVDGLRRVAGVRVISVSRLISTLPVRVHRDVDPGGEYVNGAVLIQTTLSPHALLQELHAIERAAGRDRAKQPHAGPRVLDLDLLVCGRHIVDTDAVRVPHPGLASRAFVLEPLAEIAPDLVVPGINATIAELWARLIASDAGAPA
jgi:2-amino-4-hydroxy-6-hydroxymethyldihydropteridine diphosphokinase